MIRIVLNKIDIRSVTAYLSSPEIGAIDLFIGTTRNRSENKTVRYLEYEAYTPMALHQMREICDEIGRKWEIKRIAMIHRIGRVMVGEISVIIGVSAAHRAEAFDACRFAIDMLKKNVPIWKKEYFADDAEEKRQETYTYSITSTV
jgi:molybdopterin synthase catalytic subunit